MDCSDRKEKRRAQNVKAAQKSYRTKKQERETLQQKNTELMEIQMSLLHDKSRLEEKIRMLTYVVNNMNHTFNTCLSTSRATTESTTDAPVEVGRSSVCVNSNTCNDSSEVLDLSLGRGRLTSTSGRLKVGKRNHDSKEVIVVDKTNSSCDEHILDPSFLEIGATQEVYFETCAVRNEDVYVRDNRFEQDNEVFICTPKKTKHDKEPVSHPLRRCADDAMKKYWGTRYGGNIRDRFSAS